MGEFREQAVALAAQTLKKAAADQNVYMSLARAKLIAEPVLEAVSPLLISDQAIAQSRRADASDGRGGATSLAPALLPADELVLRRERLSESLQRIEKAAALHDVSDLPLHTLPSDMRTVMSAYADCHHHLRKASTLLRQLLSEQAAPARTATVAFWEVQAPKNSREKSVTPETIAA